MKKYVAILVALVLLGGVGYAFAATVVTELLPYSGTITTCTKGKCSTLTYSGTITDRDTYPDPSTVTVTVTDSTSTTTPATTTAPTTTTVPATTTTPTTTAPPPPANTFVTPAGNDANPCTLALPCKSFDRGLDLAPAGGTVSVANGNYVPQKLTGDKASETFIVGESKAGVRVVDNDTDCEPTFGAAATMCVEAANVTLQNMTIDTGHFGNASSALLVSRQTNQSCGGCNPHNVTLRNVDVTGDYPSSTIDAAFFSYIGGTYGPPAGSPPSTCLTQTGEPIWFYAGADNAVIDGMTMLPYTMGTAGCAPGDNPHIENIRLQDDVDDGAVRNTIFKGGGDEGSGHVFTSGSLADRWRFENDTFEAINGTYAMQVTNLGTWIFTGNFFAQPPLARDGTSPALACGNTGPGAPVGWTGPC